MRVLDLDLDFFLDRVPYMPLHEGERQSGMAYHPWSEAAVREFLEQRCGLSRIHPTPGKFVVHHHEAFLLWRELIQRGQLAVPFDVVHVDSHADLGMGDGGYRYLMTDVLHRAVDERSNVEIGEKYLMASNYLAFAVACRWIQRLIYVTNPHAGDDLRRLHFKDRNTQSGFLQLKACKPSWIEAYVMSMKNIVNDFVFEPEVPFQKILPDDFQDTEGFSFAVLCQSPDYTPEASDALIPVIMEYLNPI